MYMFKKLETKKLMLDMHHLPVLVLHLGGDMWLSRPHVLILTRAAANPD